MSSPTSPGWSTIDVAGHACDLFQPASVAAAGRCLLYLHDLDERPPQELTAVRNALETSRLPVMAPRTGRSWWLQHRVERFDLQATPEVFLLGPVLEECQQRFAAGSGGVGLIGLEMGGQGALRLAYRHPAIFPVAAAINPAIDFHLGMRHGHNWDDGELFDTLWEIFPDVEQARQETAILHVHPLNWPRHQWFVSDPADLRWRDGAERLHSKLVALGIPHTALLDPAAGDVLAAMSDAAVAFVLQALESESRRVV